MRRARRPAKTLRAYLLTYYLLRAGNSRYRICPFFNPVGARSSLERAPVRGAPVAALTGDCVAPMLDASSAAVAQASTIVIGSKPFFWNAIPSSKPPGCSAFYEAAVGDLLVFKYGREANVWQLADRAAWEACSFAGATKLAGENVGGASAADSAAGIFNRWSAVTTAPGVLHFAVAYYSTGNQDEFCLGGQKTIVRVSDGQAPTCPPSLPPFPLPPPSPPPPAIPAGGASGSGDVPPALSPQSACASYVKNESLWVASSASGHAKCYGVQGVQRSMIGCRNHCGYAGCEHVPGAYCSSGATEVTIDNAEENVVVLSLFGKLSAEEASLDGMQLSTRSQHANWANGQPQKPSSGTWCAVIQSNGLWASRTCSEKAVCLCQFDLPPPPSPPPSPPRAPLPSLRTRLSPRTAATLTLCFRWQSRAEASQQLWPQSSVWFSCAVGGVTIC